MYTRIYGQQQLGKCLCVAGSQPTRKKFRCKIIFALNIFVRFLCTKIFLYNEIKANYGTITVSTKMERPHPLYLAPPLFLQLP